MLSKQNLKALPDGGTIAHNGYTCTKVKGRSGGIFYRLKTPASGAATLVIQGLTTVYNTMIGHGTTPTPQ